MFVMLHQALVVSQGEGSTMTGSAVLLPGFHTADKAWVRVTKDAAKKRTDKLEAGWVALSSDAPFP